MHLLGPHSTPTPHPSESSSKSDCLRTNKLSHHLGNMKELCLTCRGGAGGALCGPHAMRPPLPSVHGRLQLAARGGAACARLGEYHGFMCMCGVCMLMVYEVCCLFICCCFVVCAVIVVRCVLYLLVYLFCVGGREGSGGGRGQTN